MRAGHIVYKTIGRKLLVGCAVSAVMAMIVSPARSQEDKASEDKASGQAAQPTAQTASGATVTTAELQQSVGYFNILMAALNDKTVSQSAKTKIFSCVYLNDFKAISREMDQTFAQNKTLSKAKSADIFLVLAGVCGVTDEDIKPSGAAANASKTPPGNAGRQ